MRRTLSIFLTLTLMLTLAACGSAAGQGGTGPTPTPEGSAPTSTVPETPYTSDDLNYNDRSSRSSQEMDDLNARPAISGSVDNMEQYDVIFLGYPNWWASIPMPIASFLEEYDFSGKTIVPFCSHGGGRFGQSLTAITKLVPDAVLGEGLAVSYSGGSGLSSDVTAWLNENGIS